MEKLWIVFIIASLLFTGAAMFVAIFQGQWVDEAIAFRTLETQGYANAQIVKTNRFFVAMRGCGSNDAAKFTMKAKNPVGKEVELFVCAGWLFKGATIRSN